MPLIFVHGVAVREGNEPDWATLQQVTQGVEWRAIEALLREHVAPVMRPEAPQAAALEWLYWGDLGAHYTSGGRFRGAVHAELPHLERPLDVPVAQLAQWIEDSLLPSTPAELWPATIEAAAYTASDENVRLLAASLEAEMQGEVLLAAAKARTQGHAFQPTLLPTALQVQRRRQLQRLMGQVRRPLEDFVPIFLGDALTYLTQRGTPQQPGPVPQRILAALRRAHIQAQATDEPLVIVSHSLGCQLVYDVLSSLLPAQPDLADLRVDLWCAVGSQLGMFKELGLMLEDSLPPGTPAPERTLSDHLGYLWNVWSYSDLLSFRTEGVIPSAHDAPFPLPGHVRGDHLAYLQRPVFYAALAAKLRSVLDQRP
ncbi:hypothetical protein GCM10017783_06680 [Deinococcus piscis]|uniref:Alpha/beta hydrolase n=1 Tax=Deinococcus piscis TaxID=394230 RepID=A0ABQ3K052_9DEIO|nr:hypothetical protein [Deinococcus piscis]GHF97475.1 hypothetical protein GCM10017783_06680 [Deinococcus piscis]